MSDKLMEAIVQGQLREEVCICIRCKMRCSPVEDCFEDGVSRQPFLESDCCGAPVVFKPAKQVD